MPELLALPYPGFDPVAIQIGPLAIRWYALAYLAGLLIGWRMMLGLARRPNVAFSRADADDFLVWAIAAVLLGGRFGYVLAYNPAQYLAHPEDVLFLWRGGMSFHGGLAGVAVAMAWFARRRGIPVLALADAVASVVPVGLFFGRVANFINGELWGRVADVPWAMAFPGAGPEPRHPSQLYEAALEGVVLFVVLRWIIRKPEMRARRGLTAGVFLAGYGVSRLFVEFFREPDAHIGFLVQGSTLGQWLSLPVLAAGLWLMARAPRPAP